MSKRFKGALHMIIAGAVTFSVTNALLVDDTTKGVTKENALAKSDYQERADVISRAVQPVKNQMVTKKEDERQVSPDISAVQVASKRTNKSYVGIKINKKTTTATNTVSIKTAPPAKFAVKTQPAAKPTLTNPKNTVSEKPAAPTKLTTAVKPTKPIKPAVTTKPATTAPVTPSTKAKPEAATNNRGQQVSQEAKAKAAVKQEEKDNNAKTK